jgi:ABC-type lipoprotein export system ATPase subunit
VSGLRFQDFTVTVDGRLLVAMTVSVPAGSTVLFTGPAGTGTSAVLAAVVGALTGEAEPGVGTSGSVTLDDEDTDGTDTADVADPRHCVGLVTREHELLGGLTAAENVLVGVLARRRPTTTDDERVVRALDALAMPVATRGNLVEQLSGGQQQRVAVARAIATGAPVLALDDPVSELDDRTTTVVHDALAEVARGGTVVLVAVPDGAAAPAADLVVRVGGRGRHVSDAPPAG